MNSNYLWNLYKDESKHHVSTNKFFLDETHYDHSFPASHFSYNTEGPHKWLVNSYHMRLLQKPTNFRRDVFFGDLWQHEYCE